MRPFQIAQAPRTKILVVDDQPANLLSVRAILEPLDQEIIEARSGEEALRQLLAHDVAVVLLDIQMPGLDGFEVARLIRGREKERYTPIIFLTAFEDHRFTIPEAYDLGAIDYLVKPIIPTILLAKVSFFVELYQKAELLKQYGAEQREKGRESESRRAAILETALDCIISIDHEGRIVEFNPAAETTFGYRKVDVLGQPMPDLIMPARYRALYYKGVKRYLETGEADVLGKRIEITGMRSDGSEFPVELSIVPHGSKSAPLFTAYLRDITERQKAEEELRSAILREQERAEELREADRRKDEFLAMLAHELRNPLAAVANSLQISRLPEIDKESLRWSQEVMSRQVELLTRLMDDLLDVSRITRGKITLKKDIVPLVQLIERAAAAAKPQFEAKRQEFRLMFSEHDGLWIDADPARIEQILGNLLTNATKYTQEGGQIGVSVEQDGNEAVVRVTDNGIGISAEMLPHLFDPFAQAENALDRAHGGLGIGLTLVRSLAEMHGGSATAHSSGLSRGSEFTLRLPLAAAPTEAAVNGSTEISEAGRRILVVDDNQDAAMTLSLVLEVHGHTTRLTCSGRDALTAVKEFEPEVVLLDIGLPEMDGYEVARRIRRMERGHEMCLVAITGYGQPDDRARSREAGFDFHLVKPVDLSELLPLCTSWCKAARSNSDASVA
jgi:PAS domain S-box-containing protein